MALAYLQIFADKAELLEPFDDAERGRLLSAMLSYALHDVEPVLTGNERYIWPVFRQMIDQSKAALQSKQAGGRARQATRQAADGSSDQQTEAEAQQTAAESSSVAFHAMCTSLPAFSRKPARATRTPCPKMDERR